MLVSGYRVLDIAFLCFRILDITILCYYLATEYWILLSYAPEFWTLQFCANIWLQSPGYCFPMLQNSGDYNFMPISGCRVPDIAFLCSRILEITILCQYLHAESRILLSYAPEFWRLQFYANIWLQSPGYCFPMLRNSGDYNFMPISGCGVLDIAFLCSRILEITILCQYLATES